MRIFIPEMKKKNKALQGIKVIDASTVLAGPSVGMFLAELGADVTKVEHPKHKDVTRSWKLPSEDSNTQVSAYFASINYGKNYESLDLSDEEDYNNFMTMVEEADILLMNFKRSDYEKFGLTDEALRAFNTKLIVGKISGYGADSDRVAYDLILQAESGFMSMNGQADGPPTKMPVAMIDVLAAHHLKEAILLALYERTSSDEGCIINVSLYDAAVSSLVNQASNYLMTDHIPQRIGSKHPNIAPYGELFQTSDGKTITFAIGSDTHFQKLCETLGDTDLLSDQRFKSNQLRVVHREALFLALEKLVARTEASHLLQRLEALNVPAGAVRNLEEVFNDTKASRLILEEVIEGVKTQRVASAIFT